MCWNTSWSLLTHFAKEKKRKGKAFREKNSPPHFPHHKSIAGMMMGLGKRAPNSISDGGGSGWGMNDVDFVDISQVTCQRENFSIFIFLCDYGCSGPLWNGSPVLILPHERPFVMIGLGKHHLSNFWWKTLEFYNTCGEKLNLFEWIEKGFLKWLFKF